MVFVMLMTLMSPTIVGVLVILTSGTMVFYVRRCCPRSILDTPILDSLEVAQPIDSMLPRRAPRGGPRARGQQARRDVSVKGVETSQLAVEKVAHL